MGTVLADDRDLPPRGPRGIRASFSRSRDRRFSRPRAHGARPRGRSRLSAAMDRQGRGRNDRWPRAHRHASTSPRAIRATRCRAPSSPTKRCGSPHSAGPRRRTRQPRCAPTSLPSLVPRASAHCCPPGASAWENHAGCAPRCQPMTEGRTRPMTTTDFDARAATWDDDPSKVERARAIADAIVAQCFALATSMRALEYGCGTGLLSFMLRPRLGDITLADVSEGMLDVAAHKIVAAQRQGHARGQAGSAHRPAAGAILRSRLFADDAASHPGYGRDTASLPYRAHAIGHPVHRRPRHRGWHVPRPGRRRAPRLRPRRRSAPWRDSPDLPRWSSAPRT